MRQSDYVARKQETNAHTQNERKREKRKRTWHESVRRFYVRCRRYIYVSSQQRHRANGNSPCKHSRTCPPSRYQFPHRGKGANDRRMEASRTSSFDVEKVAMSSGCDRHRAKPAKARDERPDIGRYIESMSKSGNRIWGPIWRVIIVTSAFGTRSHSRRRHEYQYLRWRHAFDGLRWWRTRLSTDAHRLQSVVMATAQRRTKCRCAVVAHGILFLSIDDCGFLINYDSVHASVHLADITILESTCYIYVLRGPAC